MAETDEPVTPAGRLFVQPLMDQVTKCAIAGELPVNLESVKTELQDSIMLKHPRFCSVVVEDSAGHQLYWRRTAVDVDRRVIIRQESLSDDPFLSNDDAVNDYVADLTVSSPLSPDKSLWEIHSSWRTGPRCSVSITRWGTASR